MKDAEEAIEEEVGTGAGAGDRGGCECFVMHCRRDRPTAPVLVYVARPAGGGRAVAMESKCSSRVRRLLTTVPRAGNHRRHS